MNNVIPFKMLLYGAYSTGLCNTRTSSGVLLGDIDSREEVKICSVDNYRHGRGWGNLNDAFIKILHKGGETAIALVIEHNRLSPIDSMSVVRGFLENRNPIIMKMMRKFEAETSFSLNYIFRNPFGLASVLEGIE
jgi:hypothetical protein